MAQSRNDAAVFDLALSHFAKEFESRHKVAARFLVFNETAIVLEQDLGFAGRQLPADLVKALLVSNAAPRSITRYSPPLPYRRSTAEILGSAVEPARPGLVRPHYYNWEVLHRQFPDAAGILELASPVYSADGSSALVYFWTGCGNSCASGYLYLLNYSGGCWQVAKTSMPRVE